MLSANNYCSCCQMTNQLYRKKVEMSGNACDVCSMCVWCALSNVSPIESCVPSVRAVGGDWRVQRDSCFLTLGGHSLKFTLTPHIQSSHHYCFLLHSTHLNMQMNSTVILSSYFINRKYQNYNIEWICMCRPHMKETQLIQWHIKVALAVTHFYLFCIEWCFI